MVAAAVEHAVRRVLVRAEVAERGGGVRLGGDAALLALAHQAQHRGARVLRELHDHAAPGVEALHPDARRDEGRGVSD